ncbi:MAG TPA: hypothetical protein VG982_01380 [Candidatus Paceibacterota bacterium]|nr:hypothetical protein [Candidatus Paceibacterota bacterium]
MKKTSVGIGAVIIVVIAAVVYLSLNSSKEPSNPPAQTACPQDAMLCPDGSYVARTGPQCTFAPCPVGPAWKTMSDPVRQFSFQYPESIGTTYITPTDWPPQVQIVSNFTCTPGGSEIAQAGVTTQETINGHTYCVTRESEGAAGSIYTQYAYAVNLSTLAGAGTMNGTAIFTFSLRFVQCANYDDPQRTECETERQAFSIDQTIDKIISSFVSTKESK